MGLFGKKYKSGYTGEVAGESGNYFRAEGVYLVELESFRLNEEMTAIMEVKVLEVVDGTERSEEEVGKTRAIIRDNKFKGAVEKFVATTTAALKGIPAKSLKQASDLISGEDMDMLYEDTDQFLENAGTNKFVIGMLRSKRDRDNPDAPVWWSYSAPAPE